MKIILLVIAICLYVLPVHAYLEDTRAGETQVKAGDQNSSKHRLSDKNAEVLKKLKQADEYVTRVRAVGKAVNADDLEGLLLSDKEDKERQTLKKMLLDAEMKARSPRMLITQPEHEIYANLSAAHIGQIKDAQTARELWQQLKEGAR